MVVREISPVDLESAFPFKSDFSNFTSGYEHVCQFCGTVHNEGLGLNGSEFPEGESVAFFRFGDLQVGECCFKRLESAVLDCAPEIIAWLEYRAEAHRAEAKYNDEMARRGRQVMEDAFGDEDEVPF